ncbi:hypothetical protein TRAPUB_11834 [Trametes pubescens]|uniref:Uncharacterized protein n=1 Tax=Trametes pubescens TaxID=154538 RepID=A0A1M2VVK6_TRAPU|nr:hypothetical protein TRAPUB_11834 [Trametes pubescens]
MPAGILVVGHPFSDRRVRAWCKNPPPDKLGVREAIMQAISETRKVSIRRPRPGPMPFEAILSTL